MFVNTSNLQHRQNSRLQLKYIRMRLVGRNLIITLYFLPSATSWSCRSYSLKGKQRRKHAWMLQMMQVWSDDRDESKGSLENLSEEPDMILRQAGNCENISTTYYSAQGTNIMDNEAGTKVIGIVANATDEEGQQAAMAAMGSVEWILVDSTSSWNMIPAENLIAAAQSSGTKLAFSVDKASDVGGLARALELGVDALCVPSGASSEVWEAAFRARAERKIEQVSRQELLPEAQIHSGSCWRRQVDDAILADRICVDLVQTLSEKEGCWIGSSAKLLALVLSEAASSQFVPTRPFRVNAGPVHSYILLADQSTKYLCELRAGDQVLVYNSINHTTRSVAVGRLKQEIRPCVLVELQAKEGETGQVFLQQAETVRLGSKDGAFVRVTDLQAQKEGKILTSILIRTQTIGTHIGKIYSGKVTET